MSEAIQRELSVAEKRKAHSVAQQRQQAERAELYRAVFGTKEGKVVLADMRRAAGLNKRVFVPQVVNGQVIFDPISAALNDGSRNVIIRIDEILATPPGAESKKKPKVIK